MVQVQRDGEETGLGEPVGLIAVILRHAARVVEDDDPRHAVCRGRDGQVSRHLIALHRDEDTGHVTHLLWGGGSPDSTPWTNDPVPKVRRNASAVEDNASDERKPALALAAEQKHQFNEEDNHHQHLQNEGPALVKLIHHKLVQFAGRMQFPVDQPAVILHAYLGGGQAIQTGREHIAQELDRGVHPFGKLANVQTNCVQVLGLGGQPPPRQEASFLLQGAVDAFEQLAEHRIVIAKLEQLRIGVLQKLNGRGSIHRGVMNERGRPTDYQ